MSKTNADPLFSLIKAMGKGEKRHFKIFSRRHIIGEENTYVKLFDAIEAQKDYDEKALRKNSDFQYFSTLKSRLLTTVLRSLEEFHSGSAMEVRSLLNHIEILFDKSLFAHCLRQVQKAKVLAGKFEMFEYMLEILQWEHRLAIRTYDMGRVQECLAEEEKYLQLYVNYKRYRDLSNSIAMKYQRMGHQRRESELLGIRRLAKSALLKNAEQARSFRAKQSFYECQYFYAITMGDFRKVSHYGRKMIGLFRDNEHMIPLYPSAYLGKLNKLLLGLTGQRHYNEMLPYLEQLKKERTTFKSAADRTTAFFYLYHLLNYYIWTGRFSEADHDIKEIEHELPEHEAGLNRLQKMVLYELIALVYFGRQEYRKCLHWLNRTHALGEMQDRKDIESFIRIFQLVVHYEMGSSKDFMASLFKSTYRFLYGRERIYKFEAAVMEFIKQNLLKEVSRKELRNSFREIKATIEALAKHPYEKHALEFFDYLSWLESKVEGKTFAEVVRSKQ